MTPFRRARWAFAGLLTLFVAGRLPAQTKADTAHLVEQTARCAQIRDVSNNRNGVKDKATACIAAESTHVKDHATPPPPVGNTAPTAVISAINCDDNRRCVATQASTDDKGVVSYAWNWGDGATSTAQSPSHTYATYRTATVSLTVKDSAGLASAPATKNVTLTAPVPPEDTVIVTPPQPPPVVDPDTGSIVSLPKTTPSAATKPFTRVVSVNIPEDLQVKLNATQPGDRLELAAGEKWVGNFVLPARTCSTGQWITVTTKGAPDVVLGNRVNAAAWGTFAKVMSNNNQPALATAIPTKCWQLYAFEIVVDPAYGGLSYGLVTLGDGGWVGGGEKQTTRANVPSEIILRRMYVHGQTASNLVRCVAVNSENTAIVDSYVDQCHASGFDSQAIEGWNGTAGLLLENNYLAGAGENIMFGGADPAAEELIPRDITIRRNYVRKDPGWKCAPTATNCWSIKNLFELKDARRVLAEGNVFENVWPHAQSGMAIVFKSTTDVCGTNCMWEGTTDVTFRWNIVRNAHRALNVQGFDNSYVPTGTNVHTKRVLAENNLFTGIGTTNGIAPSDGWLILPTHDIAYTTIRWNTFVGNTPDYGIALYFAGWVGVKQKSFVVTDNILAGQSYYGTAGDGAPGCCDVAFKYYTDTASRLLRNVISEVDADFQRPTGNFYAVKYSDIGFAPDYSLLATSPFKGKGAGGADPGVNVATLTQKTAGVVQPVAAVRGAGPAARAKPLTLTKNIMQRCPFAADDKAMPLRRCR